ncbi:putative ankyrin repeat protein RF_0381 [Phymastichus coffea]|uniref:putative ankyrin repeat protein RF_0381 n=1 Tax=Phymastichus coffea TaxID=108790 RepID=UPI00273A9E94|nr:putative ankyrin repeat protein RF_0381 [Phymastichus coffea]
MSECYQFPPEVISDLKNHKNDDLREALKKDKSLFTACDDFGTLLHYAALLDNADIMPDLVAGGSDPNSLEGKRTTPIVTAALSNSTAALEQLFRLGGNFDINSREGLFVVYKLLSEQRTEPDMIAIFIDKFVKPKTPTPREMADIFTRCGSSLYHVSCARNISVLEEMLTHRKMNINSKGDLQKTALHSAVMLKDLNLVKWLLLKGIDINAIDVAGFTALSLASYYGQLNMIKVLLRYGANANAKDTHVGLTPVYLTFAGACKNITTQRYDECADYLLHNGGVPSNPINILSRNSDGCQFKTLADHAFDRCNYKRFRSVVCHQAICHMAGIRYDPTYLYSLNPENQPAVSASKEYFLLCLKLLDLPVFKRVTIFELLTWCDYRLKDYVRDRNFKRVFTEASVKYCLSLSYPYYYDALMERISRLQRIIFLEDALQR